MKRCSKCGETKPPEEFPRNARNRDGRGSWCSDCDARSMREARWKKAGVPGSEFAARHLDHAYQTGLRETLKAIGWKYCYACDRNRPQSEFPANASKSDGFASQCRECNAAAKGEWRAENRERASAYAAQWRAENPEYFAQWRAENRDKRRAADERRRVRKANLPYDGTTREDLIADAIERDDFNCWWCSAAFTAENPPVVEHIEPVADPESRGHVWDNLSLSCAACNGSKWAKDPIEWYRADIENSPAHSTASDA